MFDYFVCALSLSPEAKLGKFRYREAAQTLPVFACIAALMTLLTRAEHAHSLPQQDADMKGPALVLESTTGRACKMA